MDSNDTEFQMESQNKQDAPSFIIMIYITLAFVLLSIASNYFTLVVLRSGDIFNEVDLILYRLLAVEDMITSIVTLTSFVIYETADFATVGIPFFWYCQMPFFYQTIGVVLSISICRYLMIVSPMHYPMWVTRKKVIVSQIVLFVVSFVISVLLKLIAELWIGNANAELRQPIVTYIIPMPIGFLVQLFTGSQILFISVRQSRRLRRGEHAMFHQELRRNTPIVHGNHGDQNNPEILQEPKRKSFKGLKTVLVIIGSYWIAWFPVVLNAFKEMDIIELPNWFRFLSPSTILINICWNPLIYYLTNRAFRDAANRTVGRMKSRICQIFKTQTVPVLE